MDTAKIPCMRFTYENFRRPNYPAMVTAADTLQIISVQVKEITGGLEWPLDVYGIVAFRDVLDRRRIMVFDRQRDDCQRINGKVCHWQNTLVYASMKAALSNADKNTLE